MPGAFGTADETDAQGGGASPSPAPTALDLVAEVTCDAEPYTVGDGPLPRRRLRLRHQAHDPAPPRQARHRRGRARVHAAPPTCSARAARRRVPLQRPGRPRGGDRTRSTTIERAARQRADVRHLPRPPAARRRAGRRTTYKLKFGHHGGNHPVQRLADGAVEITSQNHNFAVDRGLDRQRRRHARQPQRRRRRGHARAATCPPSACSTTPRPGPARTTPRYLFAEFDELMARQLMPKRDRHRVDPASSGPGRS